MAGRQRCRNNGGATTAQEQEVTCGQSREQEEMPMCRYVNLNRSAMGCSGVERQLCETNRLLAELLRAVQEQ